MIFGTALSSEHQVSEVCDFFVEHFPSSVAHNGALEDFGDEVETLLEPQNVEGIIQLLFSHSDLLLKLPVQSTRKMQCSIVRAFLSIHHLANIAGKEEFIRKAIDLIVDSTLDLATKVNV